MLFVLSKDDVCIVVVHQPLQETSILEDLKDNCLPTLGTALRAIWDFPAERQKDDLNSKMLLETSSHDGNDCIIISDLKKHSQIVWPCFSN